MTVATFMGGQGAPVASRRPGPAIGQILVARGALGDRELAAALALMPERGCRLGELVCAHGWSGAGDVAAALAEQWGLAPVDLAAEPPDPDLLAAAEELGGWLAARRLPWRRLAGRILHVTDDPVRALADGKFEPADLVVTTAAQFDVAVQRLCAPALAERAARRTAAGESVRSLGLARAATGAGLAAAASAAWLLGGALAGLAAAALLVLNALTTLLRLAAMLAGERRGERLDRAPNVELIRWPRIDLLVPLYREGRMVPEILAAIDATDYPRELLGVKFIVEADDRATQDALSGASLPGWASVLVVPGGAPRTKPRALNYALDFCHGGIVGILDAEDRPEPAQFRRVARHLAAAQAEVACVQCQLSFFNAAENWITRCFQVEYSIWFDVLLRGFQRLGLPIPLGGTSVYFRRDALERLGGWDAHNVTEDADLGMRLARRGLRCEVLDSTTQEEANCRALPWVRQRSRWLKGYILTWLSHMRRPLVLWRDLGAAGFFGLNLLLMGGAVTYLAMPLFWVSVGIWAASGQGIWAGLVPDWLLVPLGVSLGFGQAVMLGCAALAMMRRGTPALLWWVPVLPFYWTLGSIAAWKAVAEVLVAPYYWDKTRHGVSALLAGQASRPGPATGRKPRG
ncbi:glycosyltransferase [Limibaculum sp. FT325]|uniref:glycosyltransferase family 2 protein n=1 Tax=Thermohalobaculum sediminis TaxID=2939436 RepID=UPI0020BED455|nr:glycosyltransferase family 2 protein [Limibaculum sediminis]MCL5777126.1 glycosyltransferase [Limibaculum sediminis]